MNQAQRKLKEVNEEEPLGLHSLTKAEQKKIDGFKTWADKYRYLSNQGYETKHIAKILGKLYQAVRNTLVAPVPKS